MVEEWGRECDIRFVGERQPSRRWEKDVGCASGDLFGDAGVGPVCTLGWVDTQQTVMPGC